MMIDRSTPALRAAAFSVPFLGSLCLLGVIFRAPLSELWEAWQTPDYSHGPLIPLLAAVLLANRLRHEEGTEAPTFWGLAPLLPALVLLILGTLSTFNALALYGLVMAVTGLLISTFGPKTVARNWPPLVYLLFAIPLPNILYAGLSSDLQLISSTLGVDVLDLLGVPVFQDGNIIDLGTFKLQVVEACSGLRYLFPLLSFGYLAAYLIDDRAWKRAVLLLSAIPITIGMNSLRIALIGVTVSLWGQGMAEGLIHDFEGWTIFLLCAAILWAEMHVLLHIGTRGRIDYDKISLRPPARRVMARGTSFTAIGNLVLLALVALGMAVGSRSLEGIKIAEHRPLASFPLVAGEWRGNPGSLDPTVLKALQLSDYWIADYHDASQAIPVNFYIAYYATQRAGSATHSPSSCIPGGGWKIAENGTQTLALDGTTLRVRRILIQKGSMRQVVYYWFDERGRDLTDEVAVKWWMIRDSVVEHRNDGSLIRLVAPVPNGEGPERTEQAMSDLLRELYPALLAYLPPPVAGAEEN